MAGITPDPQSSTGSISITADTAFFLGWNDTDIVGWNDTDVIGIGNASDTLGSIIASTSTSSGSITPA